MVRRRSRAGRTDAGRGGAAALLLALAALGGALAGCGDAEPETVTLPRGVGLPLAREAEIAAKQLEAGADCRALETVRGLYVDARRAFEDGLIDPVLRPTLTAAITGLADQIPCRGGGLGRSLRPNGPGRKDTGDRRPEPDGEGQDPSGTTGAAGYVGGGSG